MTRDNVHTISVQNGHAHCLMCGEQNPRSLGLSFQVQEGGVVGARFHGHADLQGYPGVLHGGMIAALLDAAMTHCLFHRGVQAVTGDLHIRFLEPVPCDADLDIRAWILTSKPPLHRLKSELDCEGRVLAWAEAKFVEPRGAREHA